MKIVPPSAELLVVTPNAEILIERAGRTCYKSDIQKCPDCGDSMTPGFHEVKGEYSGSSDIPCETCKGKGYVDRDYDNNPDVESARKFVGRILDYGHESVIEHANATIKFVTDRGVTHELVRHRLASYSQESTRYCNYGKDKHGNEITVIEPLFPDTPQGKAQRVCWRRAVQSAENEYMAMLAAGASPQIARSVLPNSLKTEIVTTFNFREWRHFLRLRMGKRAHPQIRQIAYMAWLLLMDVAPSIFNHEEFCDLFNDISANIDGGPEVNDIEDGLLAWRS